MSDTYEKEKRKTGLDLNEKAAAVLPGPRPGSPIPTCTICGRRKTLQDGRWICLHCISVDK